MIEIVAKKFLCVAAVLEMIIKNMTDITVDQEEIAAFLGVNVPPSYTEQGSYMHRTENEDMLGIVLHNGTLNYFFQKFNIPLTETYVPINTLPDSMFVDFISKTITGSSIACGLSYAALYDLNMPKHIGHAIIITKTISSDSLEIYDPGPEGAGCKLVKGDDLYTAIRSKNDGIWIFRHKL